MNAKWVVGIIGGVVGYLAATYWLMLISILMVLYDAYTAWELSGRIKKRFPGETDGKFKSNAAMRVVKKIRDYCLAIVLAYMIEDKIIIMFNFYLPYVVASVFIFVEAWSILENKSSCNGAKWAMVLQKVMVDKTARHLNINRHELNSILNGSNESDENSHHRDGGTGDIMQGTEA